MLNYWAIGQYLAPLLVLSSCGLSNLIAGDADTKDAPKPIPQQIAKSWTDAGAVPGWMNDLPPKPAGGYQYWEPFDDDVGAVGIPAFRYHPKDHDVLTKLPDPGVPFGLDFHCSSVTGPWLKNMAGLKSLQSLNIGGSLLLKDEALKELALFKSLHALYLFYAPVSDEGTKHLAEIKTLRVLDLSYTRVTDAGMKELAALKDLRALNLGQTVVTNGGIQELRSIKSLQLLNLSRTKVTADGVAVLQKELPKCKISFESN